ncbi:hypothetical protein TVAG_188720 [Trichomonas vaginalis G3]|uniref:Uncharacterized protein n=1 Tax=Trichomonas vaginalis (strain ATCC PRA-98 / G3) TaxID=412133 RepID=A2EEY7_TRIV3|nr:hypothetical protein TVAGG3_0471870 [Trichomonas vaginalis G3]EAY08785.1 hypothetical protein TVAG_188720 [Trichomonas vaginalis G3]KAI5515119.1 hypothetical protein TVAGG3_0471870 [Trichomonas vaginalis G3]|eukprot:XP_001321008.1 hypothetical protein [Trichomonas vaginalis G3]
MDNEDGNEVQLSVVLSSILKQASHLLSTLQQKNFEIRYKTKSELMQKLFTIKVMFGRYLVLLRSRNLIASIEKQQANIKPSNAVETIKQIQGIKNITKIYKAPSIAPIISRIFSKNNVNIISDQPEAKIQLVLSGIFQSKLPRRIKSAKIRNNSIFINAFPYYEANFHLDEDGYCILKYLRLNCVDYGIHIHNFARELMAEFTKTIHPFHYREINALYQLDSKIYNFIQIGKYLNFSKVINNFSGEYNFQVKNNHGITEILFPYSEDFFSSFKLVLLNGSIYITSSTPILEFPKQIPFVETAQQKLDRNLNNNEYFTKKIYLKEILSENDIQCALNEIHDIIHFTACYNLWEYLVTMLSTKLEIMPTCSFHIPDSNAENCYAIIGVENVDEMKISLDYFSGKIIVNLINASSITHDLADSLYYYITESRLQMVESVLFGFRTHAVLFNSTFFNKGLFSFHFSFATHYFVQILYNAPIPKPLITDADRSAIFLTPGLINFVIRLKICKENIEFAIVDSAIALILKDIEYYLKQLGFATSIMGKSIQCIISPSHVLQFTLYPNMRWVIKIVPSNQLPNSANCIEITGNSRCTRFSEYIVHIIESYMRFSTIVYQLRSYHAINPDDFSLTQLNALRFNVKVPHLDLSIDFGLINQYMNDMLRPTFNLNVIKVYDFIAPSLSFNAPTILSSANIIDKFSDTKVSIAILKGLLPYISKILRDFGSDDNWTAMTELFGDEIIFTYLKRLTLKIHLKPRHIIHGFISLTGFSTFILKPLSLLEVNVEKRSDCYFFASDLSLLEKLRLMMHKISALFKFCVAYNICNFTLTGADFIGTTPNNLISIYLSTMIYMRFQGNDIATEFSMNFLKRVRNSKLQLIMCDYILKILTKPYWSTIISLFNVLIPEKIDWPFVLKSLKFEPDSANLIIKNDTEANIPLKITNGTIQHAKSNDWVDQPTLINFLSGQQMKFQSLLNFLGSH